MVKNFRQFVNESTLTEKVDMAELEYTLKRVKKGEWCPYCSGKYVLVELNDLNSTV